MSRAVNLLINHELLKFSIDGENGKYKLVGSAEKRRNISKYVEPMMHKNYDLLHWKSSGFLLIVYFDKSFGAELSSEIKPTINLT